RGDGVREGRGDGSPGRQGSGRAVQARAESGEARPDRPVEEDARIAGAAFSALGRSRAGPRATRYASPPLTQEPDTIPRRTAARKRVIRNAGIHRTGVRSSLSGGRSRLEPARGVGRALAAALALIAARPLPPPAAAQELAGPLVAMEQADGGPCAPATPVALADSTAGPPADTVIVVPPQSLDGLPIGAIEIEPHTIYDPVPAGRLRAFYRVANRLHVRTRRSTVRSQLLFRPGDPWS